MAFTLKKSVKLKSRKQIGLLFAERNSTKSYPLRAFWRLVPDSERSMPLQIGFSVSKRQFKKAVDRNHLKRLLREAYRLNQHPLLEYLKAHQLKVDIMLVYTSRDKLTFAEIEAKFIRLTERLIQDFQQTHQE